MKKKLLIIIHSLKRGGGAERLASNLTIQLSKEYNIFILTVYHFKNLYPHTGHYYSLKENLGVMRKILNSLKFLTIIRPLRIYSVIRKISPDFILSSMDITNVYSILSKYIFRFNIPLFIYVQNNPIMRYKKKLKYLNFLIRELYPIKSVNKIITISKGLEKILENYYCIKKDKLQTILNAIDLKLINKKKKEKISMYNKLFDNVNIIKFITIGRLVDQKGHNYLIGSFLKVKKRVPNSKLIIIGDGTLRQKLEMQIKKGGLKDDVLLLGFKENPIKYLAKSDIFVLPSKFEGLPTVLLLALACGLPIISTDCDTGPREILDNGKYGLLANVMDIEDLASKMILLAKNNELKNKFSNLSIERAEFFNLNKIIHEWINLFESF
ncbi:hypothetical protein LCGC14_1912890 [marine sediment metagenome]|uniref:Glycosyl transferase family 1 domain-containing protein n=1 Tax=marine sediment metagenome TaxID=412755 RepID=A0A0F9FTN2_9ZZZZ